MPASLYKQKIFEKIVVKISFQNF